MSSKDTKHVPLKALIDYLHEKSLTQKEWGVLVGVTRGAVSTWCRGVKKPGWEKCDIMSQVSKGALTVKKLRPDIRSKWIK